MNRFTSEKNDRPAEVIRMMRSKPGERRFRTLGIMTTETDGDPPFRNRQFFRRLCLIGQRMGLAVYVFTPSGLHESEKRVCGYIYDAAGKRWSREELREPDLVYDRCFFGTKEQYAAYRRTVRELRRRNIRFLGNGLRGKWDVGQMLRQDDRLSAYLPETEPLRSMRTLAEWLMRRGEAVLKPEGGSQGRGVLHVRRTADRQPGAARPQPAAYAVRGRDGRNRPIALELGDMAALLRWLRRFIGCRRYLLQQFLLLQTHEGIAYDVRALVQKNGQGRWQITGMAARQGLAGSLTANLHGGGTVHSLPDFLKRQFGPNKAQALIAELHRLSELIPEALEQRHGRLVELGIDFGIDALGRIWFLEANSKPGRSIFTYLRDEQARAAATANPIRYARYVLAKPEAAVSGERPVSVPDSP